MRIVGVSDVSLGYGSPQIAALLTSLTSHYGAAGIMLEPDQHGRPPRHEIFPHLKMRRINSIFDPHSMPGRIEYLQRAAQVIEELAPDILVIYCTFCLPVLFKLRYRPRLVIYYSIESIPSYGAFDLEMNHHIDPLVDIIIFPEENRAIREVSRFRFQKAKKLILYNCADSQSMLYNVLSPSNRNGRVIYFGTIDRKKTLGDYFLHSQMRRIPVDLFGTITATNLEETEAYITQLGENTRYHGVVDSHQLDQLKNAYSYSLVMWDPSNENQKFAAPNKFFESIAAGVPPIAAPHPQCKMLIQRYECGILMADWSFNAFYTGVCKALNIYGTEAYNQMVHNCIQAVKKELNWEAQFEKLKPLLS